MIIYNINKVDIVIPVYNEEDILERNIIKLRNFLLKNKLKYKFRIIISDNNSTDETSKIGEKLSKKFKEVTYLHIPTKGRGIALRTVWMKSKADVVSFMDADLSTDLHNFPTLIECIHKGYDGAIGSRLLKDSIIKRSFKREIISRVYNLIIKILFLSKFTDVQVGFKAFKTSSVQKILPMVKDNEWFFDTELLVLLERKGYKLKDINVKWDEDSNTSVNIAKTSSGLLKKAINLRLKLFRER
jgi:glycosyltransferase involved in cell wall biosynthesis